MSKQWSNLLTALMLASAVVFVLELLISKRLELMFLLGGLIAVASALRIYVNYGLLHFSSDTCQGLVWCLVMLGLMFSMFPVLIHGFSYLWDFPVNIMVVAVFVASFSSVQVWRYKSADSIFVTSSVMYLISGMFYTAWVS